MAYDEKKKRIKTCFMNYLSTSRASERRGKSVFSQEKLYEEKIFHLFNVFALEPRPSEKGEK